MAEDGAMPEGLVLKPGDIPPFLYTIVKTYLKAPGQGSTTLFPEPMGEGEILLGYLDVGLSRVVYLLGCLKYEIDMRERACDNLARRLRCMDPGISRIEILGEYQTTQCELVGNTLRFAALKMLFLSMLHEQFSRNLPPDKLHWKITVCEHDRVVAVPPRPRSNTEIVLLHGVKLVMP